MNYCHWNVIALLSVNRCCQACCMLITHNYPLTEQLVCTPPPWAGFYKKHIHQLNVNYVLYIYRNNSIHLSITLSNCHASRLAMACTLINVGEMGNLWNH